MKRLTKVAAVGAAALSLLAGTTPAHALADFAVITFTGNFLFAPALRSPTPGATGSNGAWTLTGSGIQTHTDGPQPGLAVGTASINISGDLKAGAVQQFVAKQVPALGYLDSGGFCGASGGENGAGNIAFANFVGVPAGKGRPGFNPAGVNWIQSAASLIVIQGGTPAGKNYLAGVATVVPTASSCISFTVVGALVAFF